MESDPVQAFRVASILILLLPRPIAKTSEALPMPVPAYAGSPCNSVMLQFRMLTSISTA